MISHMYKEGDWLCADCSWYRRLVMRCCFVDVFGGRMELVSLDAAKAFAFPP
jgi:hypothetical protein